jgi:hypothetical protein
MIKLMRVLRINALLLFRLLLLSILMFDDGSSLAARSDRLRR